MKPNVTAVNSNQIAGPICCRDPLSGPVNRGHLGSEAARVERLTTMGGRLSRYHSLLTRTAQLLKVSIKEHIIGALNEWNLS